ncbi:MAG: YggT family protein [bacterium]
MSVFASYQTVVGVVRIALFYTAAAVAVVCAFDWAVRTRRINPFSRSARFFRGRVDPALMPLERMIVRAGGAPSSASWWALVAFVVGSIGLISLLDFLGDILYRIIAVSQQPSQAPMLLLSWTFAIVRLALLVRVLSSWFPISPYSKWIRWSYVLTDWMIIPLSRLIPRIGMIDLSPIVAWFLLSLLQRALGIA